MTSQGRACPVNVGVSPPKCPNKVGTARTHTHTHTCFNGQVPGLPGLANGPKGLTSNNTFKDYCNRVMCIFTHRIAFLMPNHQYQSTEGIG